MILRDTRVGCCALSTALLLSWLLLINRVVLVSFVPHVMVRDSNSKVWCKQPFLCAIHVLHPPVSSFVTRYYLQSNLEFWCWSSRFQLENRPWRRQGDRVILGGCRPPDGIAPARARP